MNSNWIFELYNIVNKSRGNNGMKCLIGILKVIIR